MTTDTTRWAFEDQLGTVRQLATYNSGTTSVVKHRDYDSFGNLINDSAPTISENFGYAARYTEKATGDTQNGWRWYKPRIGQFTSEDPIRDGENWRAYVGNHPTYATDPSGLAEVVGPNDPPLSPAWEATKAGVGGFFGTAWNGITSLVTGRAGWAMGERAVAMSERATGEKWKGNNWGRFSWHMTGEVLGTNCMAEGMVGTDMANGRSLDATERGTRFAGGMAAFAGMMAGGLRALPIKYSALPGSALVARATAPVANAARGVGAAIAARLPAPVTAAASAVGRALAFDIGAYVTRFFQNLSRRACEAGNYLSAKAPYQVTPGVRIMKGQYVNDLGRIEPWVAHYDQYGRLIARTDFNAANRAAGIPSTHHHTYRWGRGMTPLESGSHIPGEFVP